MEMTYKEVKWICIMLLIETIAIVLYTLQITSLYITGPLFIVFINLFYIFCKET